MSVSGKCLATLIFLVAACERSGWDDFRGREASYRFPTDRVHAINTTPYRFIRVSPMGEPFDLVFDSRIDDQVDASGYPKIFSVSEGPLGSKSYATTPAGVVACRTNIASVDCGMSLTIAGDQWSVLFPVTRKDEAESIAQRAAAFISRHVVESTRAGEPASGETQRGSGSRRA